MDFEEMDMEREREREEEGGFDLEDEFEFARSRFEDVGQLPVRQDSERFQVIISAVCHTLFTPIHLLIQPTHTYTPHKYAWIHSKYSEFVFNI
jgi:hypothetical protein